MDYHENEVIRLLAELVRIESTNEGTFEKEIGDFVQTWLEKETAGSNAEILRDEVLPGRSNVVACLKGETEYPNMVLIAHMDTVPAGNGWTRDPFGAEIIDGKMYGRGTDDMKSGLAAAMVAFRDAAISGKKPKRTLVFIGSVDEENLMSGSIHAVKKGWIRRDSMVLDTEPTGGYIIGSHKGKAWLEITTKGKAAHSSMPEMGADANAAMGEIICELQRRIKECKGTSSLGHSTICYGTLRGGVNINIVPDQCKLVIDMRLAPPLTAECAIALVKEAVRDGIAKVPGSAATIEVLSTKPYIILDENSILLKNIRTAVATVCGREPLLYAMSGYTDSGVAAAETGCIDAMSYGATGANAHQPDEFVICDSVIRLKDVLNEVLRLSI